MVVDAAQFYPGYKGQVGFSVLAAYGYAERGDPGRVVVLRAITGATTMRHWQALFGSLNGSPEVLVTDGARPQLQAAGSFPKPPLVHHCRWHELKEPRDSLTRRGTRIPGASQVWEIVSKSMYSLRRWLNLWDDLQPHIAAWNPGQQAHLHNWYQQRRERITHDLFQTAMRGADWGWSTGQVEQALKAVRDAIDARSFGLRNAARTALLLDLIRVRLNRADRFDDYLRAIADHLHQPTTQPVPQRLLNDPPANPHSTPSNHPVISPQSRVGESVLLSLQRQR